MAKSKYQHSSDCIIEQSMLNGLQMNLKDAIEYAGVKVSKSDCLWQYPEIIRDNLIAKSITNINLLGNDVIHVARSSDDNEIIYTVSTIYDTSGVKRPDYAHPSNVWADEMTVDTVFNDLFKNILPAVRGVHAGDVTTTDTNGNDTTEWHNTLFNKTGLKTDLQPNTNYLRLYLTCQAEPLYILISSAITNTTCSYNVKDSDTVMLQIDKNNTLTAHISCITKDQIDNID